MLPVDAYPRVRADASLRETLESMARHRQNGTAGAALVVNGSGRPTGFITLRGVFKALEPPHSKVGDWPVPVFWDGLAEERCSRSEKISIADYVEPLHTACVQVGDNLLKVVHTLRRTRHHVLPVMDGDTPVGFIDAGAVFREICRLLGSADKA